MSSVLHIVTARGEAIEIRLVTVPIAPSAASENPWDIFRDAAMSWKSHALLPTT